MKDNTMHQEWRTVQLFLTPDYVAEVQVKAGGSGQVKCNCVAFQKSLRCNHVKHVKKVMKDNEGNYSINIPHEVDEELLELALEDAELFRQFIIDYGKVEVID